MKGVVESFPNYATDLSPRLILGLWHPVFLDAALKHVPSMRRIHIGGSPWLARTYFWKHCDGFSMWFPALVGSDGQAFLEEARKEGKDVFCWTVNRKDEMIEATRWGVKAILTDETALLQTVREKMTDDFSGYRQGEVGFFFRWATVRYWGLCQWLIQSSWLGQLEKRAGITFKDAWKSAQGLELPVVEVATQSQQPGVVLGQAKVVQVLDEAGAPSADNSPGLVAVNEKTAVPSLSPAQAPTAAVAA